MIVVDVIRADGRSSRHSLSGDENVFGSSPKAAISITDVPEIEPYHVMLSPRTDGCWVAVARTAKTEAWIAGQRFENGFVPLGTEIDVGSITLRIADPAREGKRSSWPWLLALSVLLIGGYFALTWEENQEPPRPEGAAPALFSPVQGCPDNGASALTRATNALAIARTKADRYPYAAQDGIQAVDMYTLSAVCFKAAGRDSDIDAIEPEFSRLKKKIEEDYQLHQLRIERAIEEKLWYDVLRESRALRDLVEHRPGPYREWLHLLQRHIEVQIEIAKRKKEENSK